MRVGIMQPYLLPYIGYFQLINMVDKFVIYDDIEYTKKGWINRNRFLINGKDHYFTVPLRKGSDFLTVSERYISDIFKKDRIKLLNRFKESYRKAPHFHKIFPILEDVLMNDNKNLFEFIWYSLKQILNYLEIDTEIVLSSQLKYDHALKAEQKVKVICKEVNASTYINSMGGIELYNKEDFKKENLTLAFIKSNPIEYQQFKNEHVPWLSIVDVLMFNSKEETQHLTKSYTLI